MDNTIKQVIVMRKDLNMRKGKMVAQGAHASMMFLSDVVKGKAELRPVEEKWLNGLFTKICVGVDSEQELLDIALKAGLVSSPYFYRVRLVQDSGLTEFGGIPTYTCCAIGPDYSDRIDLITGHLKLL